MNCPVCNSETKVKHTYTCNNGKVQRLECLNKTCAKIIVAQVLIVEIDPPRGRGAKAIAKALGWRETAASAVAAVVPLVPQARPA
jgi:hypothetical protein